MNVNKYRFDEDDEDAIFEELDNLKMANRFKSKKVRDEFARDGHKKKNKEKWRTMRRIKEGEISAVLSSKE